MNATNPSRLTDSPSRCRATKGDDTPCAKTAQPGKDVCRSHDPDYAEERKRNASAGGKAVMSLVSEKASAQRREIAELKDKLRELAEGVLAGEVAPQPATVAVQAYNALLRAVDLDRRVRELDEVVERMDRWEKERAEERAA